MKSSAGKQNKKNINNRRVKWNSGKWLWAPACNRQSGSETIHRETQSICSKERINRGIIHMYTHLDLAGKFDMLPRVHGLMWNKSAQLRKNNICQSFFFFFLTVRFFFFPPFFFLTHMGQTTLQEQKYEDCPCISRGDRTSEILLGTLLALPIVCSEHQ